MGFPRQEYWSGLPFPSPGDLPNPGIEPLSLALQEDSLLLSHQRRPCFIIYNGKNGKNYFKMWCCPLGFCECPWLVLAKQNPQRRQWHPTPVLLPGKSHGWRSLEGCSPWGLWGSDTTERLHFHFSLLCIGEGNGNPLQCSCLETPRDGETWWAAVYGVAQSRTRLKWLSSSSSNRSRRY